VGEATAWQAQANVFRLVGDFSEALDLQQQALDLARQIGDRHGEAECLGALGLIYQNMNDLVRALSYYEMALAIRQRTGDQKGEIRDLLNFGNLQRMSEEFDHAIKTAERVLEIAREGEYQRDQALALAALGLAYQRQGNLDKALTFQHQAIRIAESLSDPEVLWRLYGGRGDTHRLLENSTLAYDDYKAAVAQIEKVRGRLLPEHHRLGYLREERLVDYERLVVLLADQDSLYRLREALEFAERARARTFLDLLEQTLPAFLDPVEERLSTRSRVKEGEPISFVAILALLETGNEYTNTGHA
jgi:tetratricopeptide (TPR) repeat protein